MKKKIEFAAKLAKYRMRLKNGDPLKKVLDHAKDGLVIHDGA